jgi:hypothetical protein
MQDGCHNSKTFQYNIDTHFKGKKQSYCFQAMLTSVNIVTQEEIINITKKSKQC